MGTGTPPLSAPQLDWVTLGPPKTLEDREGPAKPSLTWCPHGHGTTTPWCLQPGPWTPMAAPEEQPQGDPGDQAGSGALGTMVVMVVMAKGPAATSLPW